MSVRRVTAAGNSVVFKKDHGYIEEDKSGERIWMKVKDGMYVVTLWVPRAKSVFRGRVPRQRRQTSTRKAGGRH